MEYRRFGATDLTVSEVGFGCAGLGAVFSDVTKTEMLRTLHEARDAGVTFFDTADMYTQGESEKLLGEAFRRGREGVIIASKAGYALPAQRKAAARLKPLLRPLVRRLGLKREHLPAAVRGSLSQDFSPGYILKAADGSLKRLKTDYLDLYQLHSPPTSVLEAGEVFGALDTLRSQGKIRYYGVSCETVEDALICLRYPGVSALQLRLNLLDQRVLDEAIPRAAERGVGVIARECYAGGLLARPIDMTTLEEVMLDPAEREARSGELAAYNRLAEQQACSLPALALRFVLGVDGVSVALLGMRTETHLRDNLRHLAAPALSTEGIHALREKDRRESTRL